MGPVVALWDSSAGVLFDALFLQDLLDFALIETNHHLSAQVDDRNPAWTHSLSPEFVLHFSFGGRVTFDVLFGKEGSPGLEIRFGLLTISAPGGRIKDDLTLLRAFPVEAGNGGPRGCLDALFRQ